MNLLEKLNAMRQAGAAALTKGLSDALITQFAAGYPELVDAINEAYAQFQAISAEMPDLVKLDEREQIRQIQAGYINFYQEDAVNPYVAIAGRGPWVVTLKGAVVHDSGGYGMLGFGHAPKAVLEAMSRPHVMANVMTPSLSQLRFDRALRAEIGQRRGGCPYSKFLCLNSGSEAMGLAARISDVNAKLMTDLGGRHAGKQVKIVGLKGAFHGRTDRPAQVSDSSRKTYLQHLATFRGADNLLTAVPNDVDSLKAVFAEAERNNWFIEAVFIEPVMGEGNPGVATTPAFYQAARELTEAHGSLLVIDAIQAGLRTTGYLSIVDSPGFEHLSAPDIESYSKAINAGQYPLSVLAVSEKAAGLYRKGIYGNTMTTNPRAMDVAVAVLECLTPDVRANIVKRGKEFLAKLEQLAKEVPGTITKVQGTGLLFSAELAPDFKCYGAGSTEEFLRYHGFGVIHGGTNSLRFTPPFTITDAEVDMLIAGVRMALLEGPRMKAEVAQAA
ncbi:lysine 6-aminotransferase [Ahniella affigens]|uniref:Lysine 6-aminotransferase n=1 Tax=Ahniella affigens TaxID=2021234 RepID=A0A2P1PRC5_9GAMM|nr:aminotransferase class III-fold pyridoxal phosphate-dependent enzyme [Ahniella affigens]AVP97381.1 lysine 6-aminotransferase [Ahniella affigens]